MNTATKGATSANTVCRTIENRGTGVASGHRCAERKEGEQRSTRPRWPSDARRLEERHGTYAQYVPPRTILERFREFETNSRTVPRNIDERVDLLECVCRRGVACVNAVWRSCEAALDKCRRVRDTCAEKSLNVFFHNA